MQEAEIQVGQTYKSSRWKGDRKVVRLDRVKSLKVVHYIDLRTLRTGNATLELFARSAEGPGLVSNV